MLIKCEKKVRFLYANAKELQDHSLSYSFEGWQIGNEVDLASDEEIIVSNQCHRYVRFFSLKSSLSVMGNHIFVQERVEFGDPLEKARKLPTVADYNHNARRLEQYRADGLLSRYPDAGHRLLFVSVLVSQPHIASNSYVITNFSSYVKVVQFDVYFDNLV